MSPEEQQQLEQARKWISTDESYTIIKNLLSLVEMLQQQSTEQRAELTGKLSDYFQTIPARYDTVADHYREMARRLIEDRDALKHEVRRLQALLDKCKRGDM